MQFSEKLMNQTSKNGKKSNIGTDFGLFSPNFASKIFFVGFTSTSSQTLLQTMILCNLKEN